MSTSQLLVSIIAFSCSWIVCERAGLSSVVAGGDAVRGSCVDHLNLRSGGVPIGIWTARGKSSRGAAYLPVAKSRKEIGTTASRGQSMTVADSQLRPP